MVRDNTLYFRVDQGNRELFDETRSMPPLDYVKRGVAIELAFWQAPQRLLDDPQELRAWAQAALAAAGRVAAKTKPAQAR